MTSHEQERRVSPPFLYFDNLPAWRAEHPHARPLAAAQAPTILHRPQRKTGRGLWPYPSRAILGVMLLLGLCVVAACWNARPWLPLPKELLGFDLRAAVQTPKVNSTSVEPRQMLPHGHPEPAEPPQAVVVSPGLPEPPRRFEPPTLVAAELYNAGSLDYSCFRDLHPGETPMLRNWNVVKMSSLLAVALAVNTIPAAEQADLKDDLKGIKESIDAVNKNLEKLNESLVKALDVKGDIKTLKDDSASAALAATTMTSTLKGITEQLRIMQAEIDKLQGRDILKYQGEKAGGIDQIKTQLDELQKTIAKLAEGRISKAPPATTGRILLVNLYPEEMLFLVNKQAYRVPPFKTLPLENQPPGVFEYEVISGSYGLRGSNRPLLEAGKTYTITVR